MKKPVVKVGEVRGEGDHEEISGSSGRHQNATSPQRQTTTVLVRALPFSNCGSQSKLFSSLLDDVMHFSASLGDEAARSSLGCSLHAWPLLQIPARRASAPSRREVLSEEDETRPFSNQSNQGRQRREHRPLAVSI